MLNIPVQLTLLIHTNTQCITKKSMSTPYYYTAVWIWVYSDNDQSLCFSRSKTTALLQVHVASCQTIMRKKVLTSNTQHQIFISCLYSHTNDSIVTVITATRPYWNICIDLTVGEQRKGGRVSQSGIWIRELCNNLSIVILVIVHNWSKTPCVAEHSKLSFQ